MQTCASMNPKHLVGSQETASATNLLSSVVISRFSAWGVMGLAMDSAARVESRATEKRMMDAADLN